jgi:hypothetical protein
MKRAIVIILIMILVAGGGAGGLIMLGIVPNPFNPTLPERPLTAAEKAAAELEEKNKFKPPTAAFPLVRMDDMVIPVIINGQSQRRVFLIGRLMATTAPDEAYIEAHMSRFQNALIKDLVPYFQAYFLERDMLDIIAVKARMVKNAKAVFGDHVQDVVLTNIFEQSTSRTQ